MNFRKIKYGPLPKAQVSLQAHKLVLRQPNGRWGAVGFEVSSCYDVVQMSVDVAFLLPFGEPV